MELIIICAFKCLEIVNKYMSLSMLFVPEQTIEKLPSQIYYFQFQSNKINKYHARTSNFPLILLRGVKIVHYSSEVTSVIIILVF